MIAIQYKGEQKKCNEMIRGDIRTTRRTKQSLFVVFSPVNSFQLKMHRNIVWILCDTFGLHTHAIWNVVYSFKIHVGENHLPGSVYSLKNIKQGETYGLVPCYTFCKFWNESAKKYVPIVALICAVVPVWFGRTFGIFQVQNHSMHNKWNEMNITWARAPQTIWNM